jgi:hypothetical protein
MININPDFFNNPEEQGGEEIVKKVYSKLKASVMPDTKNFDNGTYLVVFDKDLISITKKDEMITHILTEQGKAVALDIKTQEHTSGKAEVIRELYKEIMGMDIDDEYESD